MAASDRCALKLALSPGQRGDGPAGRDPLKGFRRVFSRFDKLDRMFTAFVHLALIFDALR